MSKVIAIEHQWMGRGDSLADDLDPFRGLTWWSPARTVSWIVQSKVGAAVDGDGVGGTGATFAMDTYSITAIRRSSIGCFPLRCLGAPAVLIKQ